MKSSIALLCLLLAGWLHAGTNPFEQVAEDSYAGRFVGPDVTFRLKPEAGKWTGTILFKGQNYTIQGENQDGKLAGTFGAGDQSWAFTATSDGDNLTFTAGTFTARLTRQKLPKLAGVYASKRVKLDFQNQDGGLNGTITFNGKQFHFTATETAGDLAGVFKNGDEAFQFTLVNDPAGLTFQTGKFSEKIRAFDDMFNELFIPRLKPIIAQTNKKLGVRPHIIFDGELHGIDVAENGLLELKTSYWLNCHLVGKSLCQIELDNIDWNLSHVDGTNYMFSFKKTVEEKYDAAFIAHMKGLGMSEEQMDKFRFGRSLSFPISPQKEVVEVQEILADMEKEIEAAKKETLDSLGLGSTELKHL